jgi:hypothetical protein
VNFLSSNREMGMSVDEHAEHLGLNQSKAEKRIELKNMKSKLITAIPLAIISIFIIQKYFLLFCLYLYL